MKKSMFVAVFSLLVITVMAVAPASAEFLVGGDENVIFFRNYESTFDAQGNYLPPDPTRPIQVGDVFLGIIDIQNINVPGEANHYSSTPTNQLTGFFVQEVYAVLNPLAGAFPNFTGTPDPLAPANTLPHLVLGPSSQTVFNHPDGTSINIAGMYAASGNTPGDGGSDTNGGTTDPLTNGEMLWIFSDQGAGATAFKDGGTMAETFGIATDGNLWSSWGYAMGFVPDNFSADNGYFYSHTDFNGLLTNFTGETWASLNNVVNNTAYGAFSPILDVNEVEMLLAAGCGIPPCTPSDLILSGELEANPNSRFIFDGTSSWDFRSNDPAHIIPIPEPSTMLLLGLGFIGLGAYGRRKLS